MDMCVRCACLRARTYMRETQRHSGTAAQRHSGTAAQRQRKTAGTEKQRAQKNSGHRKTATQIRTNPVKLSMVYVVILMYSSDVPIQSIGASGNLEIILVAVLLAWQARAHCWCCRCHCVLLVVPSERCGRERVCMGVWVCGSQVRLM